RFRSLEGGRRQQAQSADSGSPRGRHDAVRWRVAGRADRPVRALGVPAAFVTTRLRRGDLGAIQAISVSRAANCAVAADAPAG
ncbi:hypothetical protein chiPu_0029680, partial [Chiloscyllium punctatum]|nr:hypothetical protein [Chiloscyllium punctatum]